MKWCKHMDFSKECIPATQHSHIAVEIRHEWQYCPICAAPRPKEISLREKLAERLREYCQSIPAHQFYHTPYYLNLADIAIRTIKEHERGE